jgi:hypothetical protein
MASWPPAAATVLNMPYDHLPEQVLTRPATPDLRHEPKRIQKDQKGRKGYEGDLRVNQRAPVNEM